MIPLLEFFRTPVKISPSVMPKNGRPLQAVPKTEEVLL